MPTPSLDPRPRAPFRHELAYHARLLGRKLKAVAFGLALLGLAVAAWRCGWLTVASL